jgi:hypothetical protein
MVQSKVDGLKVINLMNKMDVLVIGGGNHCQQGKFRGIANDVLICGIDCKKDKHIIPLK